MTVRSPNRRQLAKLATRTKILGVAGPMFAAAGFDAVHTRQIAQAIGMSTGAVFSNFEDKADLFRACTGREPPDVAGFLRALACRDATSPIGDLAAEAETLLAGLVGAHGTRVPAAANGGGAMSDLETQILAAIESSGLPEHVVRASFSEARHG